jgi:uncharacterized iron-regulated membrane protein
VADLAAAATTSVPADGPVTVTVRADRDAPASVAIGPRTVYVNAYTGAVLGEGAPAVRAFFRRVTEWHRWLGGTGENRATGRMITGASNLAFFVIVLSGPLLWWPKKFTWTQIRAIGWFKGGLAAKARDFNWHNTIGIWSAIPLVVIVGSGVVMSYPWANALVFRLAGEQPPAPGRPAGGNAEGRGAARQHRAVSASMPAFDIVALVAAERPAWRTIAVRMPQSARGPLAVSVDEGTGGQPQKRGTLSLDPERGRVIGWEGQSGASAGRRTRSWLRFAHTGEVYGLFGQTIAGLASLGGVVLVWTGIALALRRLASWRLRRARPGVRARVDDGVAANAITQFR